VCSARATLVVYVINLPEIDLFAPAPDVFALRRFWTENWVFFVQALAVAAMTGALWMCHHAIFSLMSDHVAAWVYRLNTLVCIFLAFLPFAFGLLILLLDDYYALRVTAVALVAITRTYFGMMIASTSSCSEKPQHESRVNGGLQLPLLPVASSVDIDVSGRGGIGGDDDDGGGGGDGGWQP
jgi:uncharacterized membrane protein